LLTGSLGSLNKLHYWYAEYTGSVHGLRRQHTGNRSKNQAQVPRNRSLPPPLESPRIADSSHYQTLGNGPSLNSPESFPPPGYRDLNALLRSLPIRPYYITRSGTVYSIVYLSAYGCIFVCIGGISISISNWIGN